MAEEENDAKTAVEREREESKPKADSDAERSGVADALERELDQLQEGETVDSPLGPLHTRTLAAMGLMVAVSVIVFFIAWGLLGTMGLVFGWIPAIALGLWTAREYGRRKASA